MAIGQLMKCLRDKGWIPRGYNEVIHTVYDKKHKMIGLYKEGKKFLELVYKKSLRDLCAKESGLWQFVCKNKNGMIENVNDYSWELFSGTHGQHEVYKNGYEGGERWEQVDYEYRLIESALCDEDKLEEFLLDNIKIDE